MTDTIRVLYKPVGKPFEVREIPNTLEACQELVGGYIEVVKICTNLLLVCNEEGLVRGLPVNRFMNYDFRGDFFLCGVKGEDFDDVPEVSILPGGRGNKPPEYVKKPGVKKRIKAFPPYLDYPLKRENDDE